MTQEELMHWFDGLIKQVEAGELGVNAYLSNEGMHQCVDFEFKTEDSLEKDGITYYALFIMIYAPTPEDFAKNDWGAVGRRETGKFWYTYSMTSEGYVEGLYLDEETYPELFERLCRLATEQIELKLSENVSERTKRRLKTARKDYTHSTYFLIEDQPYYPQNGEEVEVLLSFDGTEQVYKAVGCRTDNSGHDYMAWNYDLKICRMIQEEGFPPFEAEISVASLIHNGVEVFVVEPVNH